MDATTPNPTPTTCREPECCGRVIRWGKDKGVQRWRCKDCGATFADRPARPMGSMRIDPERAALILGMLTEGSSIRSAERLTGTHRDTICRLLRMAGAKAEAVLSKLVRRVKVEDVQADEIWGYVGMQEKTKVEQGIADPRWETPTPSWDSSGPLSSSSPGTWDGARSRIRTPSWASSPAPRRDGSN